MFKLEVVFFNLVLTVCRIKLRSALSNTKAKVGKHYNVKVVMEWQRTYKNTCIDTYGLCGRAHVTCFWQADRW